MHKIKERIKNIASEYLKDLIKIRRHLHANPELSNQEYKTAEYIAEILRNTGIETETGIFKTGVVGIIKGKNPDKKVVALRADIDALPIIEENELDYKSINKGVMHACGHDVHTSSLIGTAKILTELKNDFEGTVKLIFQPAEEKIPGGAKGMIEEGVLENPVPDVIFGQHVFPEIDTGKIGMKSGKYMASTDEINITVKGKGGHGAMPYALVDPIVIASQIIISLQQIVSRSAHYNMPTVLSFGKIITNGTYNVVPDEVKLLGTFRTLDEEWRADAHKKIEIMAKSIAQAAGGNCDVFIDRGYPFLVNDENVTQRSFRYAKEFLGEENVEDLEVRMTGEDFSYFAQSVPSCFYRLGVRNETLGINANLHTSTFNVDESSLETGMGLMAWLTIKELNY
ncbi:MAG: amidohydrolase [Bacteroidetes bacterium]|nr:amidohydrolase [Bacteroidota bacterium]